MSLSIYNSTIVPLLSGHYFNQTPVYDNVLDFAEINISINCNVGYTLIYNFSQDKVNVSYTTSQVVGASGVTLFFKVQPKERYFSLTILASNGNMANLNVQTTYKSTVSLGSGDVNAPDVNIVGPVNGSGYVETFIEGGTVSATIANSYITSRIQDSSGNALNSNGSGSLDVSVTNTTSIPVNLAQVGGTGVVIGQNTMANSIPVVIASNQTSLAVGQTTASNLKAEAYLFDGSGNAISSSSGSLNANITSQSAGLALDASLQTLINNQKRSGGYLWNASSINNGDTSTGIALTSSGYPIASIFGNTSAGCTLTAQYSGDGTTYYTSNNNTNVVATGGNFSMDFICGAAYVRLIVSDIVGGPITVTAILNTTA